MKKIFFVILVLIVNTCFGQETLGKDFTVDLLMGLKVRATTIYPNGFPDAVPLPAINAFEQPGKHLIGPGIEISEGIPLSSSLSILLNQGIRYDYIYQRFSLEQNPPPDFQYSIKRKIIYDLFFELEKELQTNHISYFSVFLGGGVYGLNTGYYLTERFYQTPTNYTERTRKKNFIFPAVFASAGWNYKNFHSLFRLGYCWNDPTLLSSPFIFPEICFRYKFSSLLGENKRKRVKN